MAKGRKTGGRKKGTPNKRTVGCNAAAAVGPGQLPLDYMLQVMRDNRAKPERRDEMAKAAAPYLHAKRAPEDKAGRTVPAMIYVHPDLEEPQVAEDVGDEAAEVTKH